jgi:magnesium chelatase subunit D
MSPAGPGPEQAWAEALLALELFAVAPSSLGGILVRAAPGPARERFCQHLKALLPEGAPLLRLPAHVTEDRLLGGLSLADTLRAGRIVAERGLLSQADGGVVLAAMAERLDAAVCAHLCAALDRAEVAMERDGITALLPARIGVVALDEGIDDERTPAPLRDRLALQVLLDPIPARALSAVPDGQRVSRARERLVHVEAPDEVVQALCEAAVVLGAQSLRGALLAVAAARAHAALQGRSEAGEEDAAAAARLVLGPRATRLPAPEQEEQPPEQPPPPPEGEEKKQEEQAQEPSQQALGDIVREAARSGIPAGLLELLLLGRTPRSSRKSSGKAGAKQASASGGRPAGTRPGQPLPGERLNLVETLRAAAPWQPLRRAERARASGGQRIEVRRDDLRIGRFQQHSETCVIFSVDASGSLALQRLAEAKGAVEQVLADCYVRRDQVALIAFRGARAELLLPPTRSLVRVRRTLAGLPGGGTTPLAAGSTRRWRWPWTSASGAARRWWW